MKNDVSKADRIAVGLINMIFSYSNGELFWKISPNWSIKAGSKVGTINKKYLRTIVSGVKVYNHQIIFLMHHGYLPKVIDHIDGNQLNNTIENLRDVTFTQNATNRRVPISNKSGFKGVSFHKNTGKYQAEIHVNKKQMYLGLYESPIEAATAYNEAATKYFGNYSRLNNLTKEDGNKRQSA